VNSTIGRIQLVQLEQLLIDGGRALRNPPDQPVQVDSALDGRHEDDAAAVDVQVVRLDDLSGDVEPAGRTSRLRDRRPVVVDHVAVPALAHANRVAVAEHGLARLGRADELAPRPLTLLARDHVLRVAQEEALARPFSQHALGPRDRLCVAGPVGADERLRLLAVILHDDPPR
jgi:hypothetical protein